MVWWSISNICGFLIEKVLTDNVSGGRLTTQNAFKYFSEKKISAWSTFKGRSVWYWSSAFFTTTRTVLCFQILSDFFSETKISLASVFRNRGVPKSRFCARMPQTIAAPCACMQISALHACKSMRRVRVTHNVFIFVTWQAKWLFSQTL